MRGYVLKESITSEIVAAIKAVVRPAMLTSHRRCPTVCSAAIGASAPAWGGVAAASLTQRRCASSGGGWL